MQDERANVTTRMPRDRRRARFNSNREGSRTMMTKMKTLAMVTGGLMLAVPFAAHAQDDVIANAA
jgi:peptidylprolyl isomerase